jgi:hypothetical protein
MGIQFGNIKGRIVFLTMNIPRALDRMLLLVDDLNAEGADKEREAFIPCRNPSQVVGCCGGNVLA